jgi:hypothetical protein
MSHIFISYSRKDIDFARYLRASLENAGFRVWMDEKRLSAGMNWSDELQKAIDHCGAFVVIMSPDSHESKFVQSEILHAIDRKKTIFPVLLIGEPFFLLKAYQYEDMRGGLGAKVSSQFIRNLQGAMGVQVDQQQKVRFEVLEANALEFPCDVLILKTSIGSGGLEHQVKKILNSYNIAIDLNKIMPEGAYQIFDSAQAIGAEKSLFVRIVPIHEFTYRHSREFAYDAMSILSEQIPTVQHIAMTVHGVRTRQKLDESESLLAQIAGFMDALQTGTAPTSINRVSIIELSSQRTQRLQVALSEFFDELSYATRATDVDWAYDLIFKHKSQIDIPDAGQTDIKPYAVTITPDDDALEDIFYYGIQRPIHAMGLLCERIKLAEIEDENSLETLASKLQHIGQARVIVCDVSQVTPMLYLKLGYAWGKGIPTVLINQSDRQDFDAGQYINYQKIWELEERLTRWLRETIS